MVIIALHGPFGCGKDTVAHILVEEFKAVNYAFADPVRKGLLAMDPLIHGPHQPERLSKFVRSVGWDEAKKRSPEVRRLLQQYGTEAGRDIHGEDCWTKILITALYRQGNKVRTYAEFQQEVAAISDLRFPNEWEALQKFTPTNYGLLCWVIERPGCEWDESHRSEQWHPPMDDSRVSTLRNDGDLPQLRTRIVEKMGAYRGQNC